MQGVVESHSEVRVVKADMRSRHRSQQKPEVFGELRAGDEIVRRATDEIREGAALTVKR